MKTDCIFCKIISKEIPSSTVYETDEAIVIKDINPKAPIHYLIIPKKHFSDLRELQDSDVTLLGKMHLVARDLSKKLENSAFRLLSNNGKEVGQKVFHYHIHFLSGKTLLDF